MNRGTEVSRLRTAPTHPPVHFKKEPFFDVLATLVSPMRLVTSFRGWQHTSVSFQFKSQDVDAIRSSSTGNAGSRPEFSVQVHLRFCLLDATSEQGDSYPSDLAVNVNGRAIAPPAPIPCKVSGGATERVHLPINIVTSCFLCPCAINKVCVTWQPVRGREYAVGLFLVRKLSVATLLSGLQQRKKQSVALTTAMIKKKVKRRASSDDIAVTRLHVSLRCPLSRTRMTVPCRARSCNHLDCFDAYSYLQVNERRPAWMCPVCGKRAAFSSLVIDQMFEHIVANTPGDCDGVVFHEDGSWTPSQKESDSGATISATPSSSAAGSSAPPSSCASSGQDVGRPSKRPRVEEVIDLTEYSSSDEDECGPRG
ncbi:hypothetical protein HPB50_023558 [Hyalomma asiaticum]|uniref:Uncharacterized protein n=1 Tax=Hyalomma asiaticum TaxID=266040 RepID=A0ACB7S9N8_HYAAI|nr:hypothetical protein HPB50_023558 [Hyalomma asiaticum]